MSMQISDPPLEHSPTETLVEMSRVAGLSDAVFAVALTLLVLDIRIPEEVLESDLPASLQQLAPKLLVYLISFIVIGGAWGSHQRMLGQIRRGDGPFVWYNLLSLLFITLLPATAVLLGRFPTSLIAIICFAIDVILIQLSALLLWRHAARYGLVEATLDPRVVTGIGRRLGISAVGFGLAVPFAFLNPTIVYILWIGLFILHFTTDWVSWQQAAKTRQAAIPLEGASQAHITLKHVAGHLHLDSLAEETNLLNGLFVGGLETQMSRQANALDVNLRTPGNQGLLSMRFPWAWSSANLLDWDVHLTNQLPLRLDIETASGQAELVLSELQIGALTYKTSASESIIWLPEKASWTSLDIEASTASLVLHIPLDLGVRIYTSKLISSLELESQRFTISEDKHEYRTIGYETAPNQVDIKITLTIGSIKIV